MSERRGIKTKIYGTALTFIGLLTVIGSAGAIEHGAAGLGETTMRAGLGLLLFVAGAMLTGVLE